MTTFIRAAVIVACATVVQSAAAQDGTTRLPRVRTSHAAIAAAIALGIERSPTFRSLIDTIDATDGLVYVEEGKCGNGVRACLSLSVVIAGPYRLLRIVVAPRPAATCDFVGTIGHELQHAIEALSNAGVRSNREMFFLFLGPGAAAPARFETAAARLVGFEVEKEMCAGR